MASKKMAANLARDHLANERTYLAWIRTAVNVMVLGLVVAKLVTGDGGRAEMAGAVLVGVGFLILAYGTYRTRRLTQELETGRYTVDRIGTLLVAGAVGVAVAVAILLLFLR